ncbi:GIY-YIG nuclease family protein [Streptomyces sp. NPDC091383]|uniref:GIY-YIG nuclease family protein n=1 Tax=Streptomyces sp. NPDC091383 TaxID=3365996 RepID=UPI00381BF965
MKEPTHFPVRRLDRYAPNWKLLTESRIGDRILYRFYDADRQPLYIGITHTGDTRIATHRRQSKWWPLAEYIAISVYPNWSSMEKAERAAIRAEKPRFNKAGTQWRQQVIVRLDADPADVAAELHRIARPEFLAELAAHLAQPDQFPQPSPPPPPRFADDGACTS